MVKYGLVGNKRPEEFGKIISNNKERSKKIRKSNKGKQTKYRDWETDRKSTRLNSSHITRSRMPSSA